MSVPTPNQQQPNNGAFPQGTPTLAPAPAKKRGGCLRVGLIAFGVLILLSIIGGLLGGGDDAATPAPAATSQTAKQTSKAAEPAKKAEQKADEAIREALGNGNRDGVDRVKSVTIDSKELNVYWALNDNLTENMIKRGVTSDLADILKAVRDSGVKVTSVNAFGSFSMQDKLGNAEEDVVVKAVYPWTTVSAINFDNFISTDALTIADSSWLHPAFQ